MPQNQKLQLMETVLVWVGMAPSPLLGYIVKFSLLGPIKTY